MHVRQERRPGIEPVAGERAQVRAYAVALVVVALAGTAALIGRGGALETPAAFCAFALLLALCVNRFAFFPNEIAATSEAAVLVAAVVAFGTDVLSLGPLLLALLVGPLDGLHWEQRSYLRMAYNAGNRWLATMAATAAFAGIYAVAGRSVSSQTVAVVAAAIAFALTDSLLTVGLELARGSDARAALPQVFEGDALTVPLAAYGAGVGFLAGSVGWWATALALVPAAFVPELVLARARWSGRAVRTAVLVMLAAALLVALLAASWSGVETFAALAALAVLAGIELGVDRRAPIAPLLALVVVAAGLVTTAMEAPFAGAMVATIGTATAWAKCLQRDRRLLVGSCVLAGMAGALSGAVAGTMSAGPSSSAVAAVVGGVAFELLVIAVSSVGATRARRFREAGWAAPLLAAAVAGAVTWRAVGVSGALVYVVVTAGGLLAVTWWAAPPWSSRFLRSAVPRLPPNSHLAVLVATAVVACSIAAAACAATGAAATALVWVAVGSSEVAVAMALVAVRQWRFAPSRRRREIVLLATIGVAVALVYPSSPFAGRVAGLVVLIAGLVGVCAVGAGLAPTCDRAAALSARSESQS